MIEGRCDLERVHRPTDLSGARSAASDVNLKKEEPPALSADAFLTGALRAVQKMKVTKFKEPLVRHMTSSDKRGQTKK